MPYFNNLFSPKFALFDNKTQYKKISLVIGGIYCYNELCKQKYQDGENE